VRHKVMEYRADNEVQTFTLSLDLLM
jgi:hypothetical protein